MSEPKLFHVFTPQRDQPEELEKILVKRHALLDSAVGKIRESVISPDKHRLLFIGPRGMGKSYLATLIHHRLSLQKDLAEKMRFAWLNEDQTSTTFLHLLIRTYRKLADQYPADFAAGELDAIRGKDPADAREILGQALIRQMKDRTVVLIIENLDSIFNAMNEIEQRTWRGFLQDHPRFAIVATAQGLTTDISSKTKPFYGFFDINHLDPLTVDEAAELLEKIAALNNDQPLAEFIASSRGKARMRAIHHLSGGNPRLYLILSDFLTKDSLDNLVRLFEETVDRQLTPYFQERMRWLSPQQQEIVQFLCQQVHPASVKAIAEGIFIKQNTVSSQLKQLREKGYLVSKSRGKESLYELAEPLMRLSFQVKEMNHRQPLTLIVDFMRVWYDRPDLEKRLEGILPGTFGRDYFEVALQKIDTEGNAFRHSLMLACLDDFEGLECSPNDLEDLRGIAEETDNPDAWFKYGSLCLTAQKFEECHRSTSKVIDSIESSSRRICQALTYRAISSLSQGHFEEALLDLNSAAPFAGFEEALLPVVSYARGATLLVLQRYDDALIDLTSAINSPRADSSLLACALLLRGGCHTALGLVTEALCDYDSAVGTTEVSNSTLTEILSNRALLLFQMGRIKDAVDDCDQVISMNESSPESLGKTLNIRAVCHKMEGKLTDSESDLNHIIDLPQCPNIYLVAAYFGRAKLMGWSGQLRSAVSDLKLASKYEGEFLFPVLLELCRVYRQLEEFQNSLDSALRLIPCLNKPAFSAQSSSSELGAILVDSAYGLRELPETWMVAITRILPSLTARNMSSGFSAAVVKNLVKLSASDLNHAALDRWVSDWESVSEGYPEIQIGIRMLRAGVEWIKTRNDGALLDLVMEERAVVRQALGLDEDDE